MIILRYKDYIVETVPETDNCEGCIFEEAHDIEHAQSDGASCSMSEYINDNYDIECANEQIIFVENILISNLIKL